MSKVTLRRIAVVIILVVAAVAITALEGPKGLVSPQFFVVAVAAVAAFVLQGLMVAKQEDEAKAAAAAKPKERYRLSASELDALLSGQLAGCLPPGGRL
ncbi:MAG: hypothetical protein FWF71_01795 [Actinomycetia bacterium]|nr:hypothetical protein [Actinomycetes bacterium]